MLLSFMDLKCLLTWHEAFHPRSLFILPRATSMKSVGNLMIKVEFIIITIGNRQCTWSATLLVKDLFTRSLILAQKAKAIREHWQQSYLPLPLQILLSLHDQIALEYKTTLQIFRTSKTIFLPYTVIN